MPDIKQQMARVKARLQKIGKSVEQKLPRGWGYAVFAFTFDDVHRNMQWISNAERGGMIKALREMADRLEHGFAGQPGVDDPDHIV